MSLGIRFICIILFVTTHYIVVSQSAPANEAPDTPAQTPAAEGTIAQPIPSAESSAKPSDDPIADKPAANQSLTLTEPSVEPKPENATQSQPSKPSKPLSEIHDMFGNCWSCLVKAAEELCSYLTNWTYPEKLSGLNLYSLFHDKSEEESEEDSDSSSVMSGTEITSLFRFRRSSEDSSVKEEAFLDLLHRFYVKSRERVLRDHPEVFPTNLGTGNIYDRYDELAQVAAYILDVPKDNLVQAYEKMKTKNTGSILLRALSRRQSMSRSQQETVSGNSVGGLTPTSISYFFQELLGSINGITTGFSELVSHALQNRTMTAKPT